MKLLTLQALCAAFAFAAGLGAGLFLVKPKEPGCLHGFTKWEPDGGKLYDWNGSIPTLGRHCTNCGLAQIRPVEVLR